MNADEIVMHRMKRNRCGGVVLNLCLPQSSACQRSLVEVRPTIPVRTLVGSVVLLCSAGIARCIKPLAQSCNETNSSWVSGGAAVIPRMCAGFPSGRLTSSNVATWVLPTKTLTPPRRLHRIRDLYAASRTSLQCVRTRRRNCIGQLSPFSEYALRPVRFPVNNPATIKLTHYPRGGSGQFEK